MNTKRWLVSAWLLCHLAAMGMAAVPNPSRLVTDPRRPADGPAERSGLTGVLDAAASVLQRVSGFVWEHGGPVRGLASTYLTTVGLRKQSWMMFWNPGHHDRYVRVRYYVRSADASAHRGLWIATELVLPAHREDSMRLVRSYWDKHRDKTILTAIDDFIDHRNPSLNGREEILSSELPDDLAPVGRFFAARFRGRLLPDERIVRIEVWYGTARNTPPGSRADPAVAAARAERLERYLGGPVEERLRVPPQRRYWTSERESDIVWTLEYFEET